MYFDGQGFCLYYKIFQSGRFPWPSAADGTARLTTAQLAMLGCHPCRTLPAISTAFAPRTLSVVARRHDILPNKYMPGERSSRRPSWKLRRAHRLSRFRSSRRWRAPPTALRGAVFGRGPRTLKSF
ncbi:IS66 family insertion sequence element accessory protein TnpB [Sinorhizobium psoraleae]|uniref:IS66 family insertion sequence element accessory protein TnpB n=1 Tax=Sinorhizobium psoraleae TaxID=520838 RepID=UPI0035E3EB68